MSQAEEDEQGCWSCLFFSTWRPFETLRSVIVFSIVVGAVLIALAVVQIIVFASSKEVSAVYAQ